MTNYGWRAWMGAAILGVAAALPAQAALVDFEDVTPTLFSGSSISSGGFDFTSDAVGFSGVDSSLGFSIFGNAPANATGQFLFMLNADGMFMTRSGGGAFFLTAFDASLIDFGLGGALPAGALFVQGLQADGGAVDETFSFGGGGTDYNFAHFQTSALGAEPLSQVYFFACVVQPLGGGCAFDPDVAIPPQFALDNIQSASVPEPATAALALAGLCMIALRRRRQTV